MKPPKTPFTYFGAKSRIAPLVWELFDSDKTYQYIEPFAGSCAVLLNRPEHKNRSIEIVNDLNGFVVNYFRANKCEPEKLLESMHRPMSELDYHALWKVLALTNGAELSRKLRDDPDFFDVNLAGIWAYCSMVAVNDHTSKLSTENTPTAGVNNGRPNIGSRSVDPGNKEALRATLLRISERIAHTRILCGSWERCFSASVLSNEFPTKFTSIFLDPPYESLEYLYGSDSGVSQDVRNWCKQMGDNERYKIILCGYENEHDELLNLGWEKIEGKSNGNSFAKIDASEKEKLWINPTIQKCIAKKKNNPTLFEALEGSSSL